MEYKKFKRSKKAKIIISDRNFKIYSVECPFCHTNMQGDFHRTLMFECWECHNIIDLRDKDGKRSYE